MNSRTAIATLAILATTSVILCGAQPKAESPVVERHDSFAEIAPTDIKADGWLGEYLVRQQKGLTGNYLVQGYPFTIDFWAGKTQAGNKAGPRWWPYEQSAYLLDGLLRLGLLLNDKELTKKYETDLNWVIQHPAIGNRLGPYLSVDTSTEWPMAVFFKSVIAWQLAHYDPEITKAFELHYLDTPITNLYKSRDVINVEGLLWTYKWSGNTNLLAKAESAYQMFLQNQGKVMETTNKTVNHGVTYSEQIKIPILLYMFTGKPEYLQSGSNWLGKLVRDHLLVDGVPSSNEYLASRDPMQSHETCDISDFTYSLGYFLMATGDAQYADMIEQAIFNAGCGAISKDFKSLEYFSTVDQVLATRTSDQNAYYRNKKNSQKMAFGPDTQPMCCAGNVHRFMPNYVARMWMTDTNGGLVATFYGPSHITFNASQPAKPVTVTEKTDYPYGETITFAFAMNGSIQFPFTFRVPAWCSSPAVTINGNPLNQTPSPGTYQTINRVFQNGDILQVHLPMPVRLIRYANQLSLERGPLLYAYAVPESATKISSATTNVDFPTWELRPAGPWNYALDLNESNLNDRVQILQRQVSGYPLDLGQAPITLEVPVRRVNGWTLDGEKNPPLPVAYELNTHVEKIELVPYGSTRLRIAAFPEAVSRHEIPIENVKISGPYPCNPKLPITGQIYAPEASDAQAIWKDINLPADGIIDLVQLYKKTNSLAYVRAVINADADTSAILAINAKDACEIKLNGKVVHLIAPPNQLKYQFPDWIRVELRKGANQLQLKVGAYGKVGQYLNGWGVHIRCLLDGADTSPPAS